VHPLQLTEFGRARFRKFLFSKLEINFSSLDLRLEKFCCRNVQRTPAGKNNALNLLIQ